LLVLGLALVFAMLADARPDDEKKGKRKGGERPGFQVSQLAGPLVSSELADKLKLSDDQKDKVAKLQKEFEEMTKPVADKLKELREKAKDKGREAFQELRTQTEALRKTRGEFEDKVKVVLNDDQKKTFEDESKRQAAAAPGGRPGGGGQPGNLFSAQVQEKLGLNAEQKEKLDKIKKELDTKSLEVLTDEQKKKLEEIKAERPQFPRRRPQQQ